MKAKYFSVKGAIVKSFVGLLVLTTASCGSYKNVSYYENDGIYGNDQKQPVAQTSESNPTSDDNSNKKYKEYFSSNADKYNIEQSDVFTDVENYSTEGDTTEVKKQNSYAGWGENSQNVTVNVYENNWGWSNSWGWNNYYWGYRPWRNYWGFNSYWCDPFWGGYAGYYGPSYWNGWYNPYYGGYYGGYYGNGYYGRDYAYNGGRRNVAYNDRYSNTYSDRRRSSAYNNHQGYSSNPRSITPRRRDFSDGTIGNGSTSIPRPRHSSPRTSDSPRTYDTPRPRSSSPRSSDSPRTYDSPRSSSPRSSDSPRTFDSPRSYDSPRSSGGGFNGGGSSNGGGRSGGRR